jgi:recombinational DNA repair protein RecR
VARGRGISVKDIEELRRQLDEHHEGMAACEVCGWLSDEEEPDVQEEE